jgi:hypothetical protein
MHAAITPALHGAVTSLQSALDIVSRRVDYQHAQVMAGLRTTTTQALITTMIGPQIEAIHQQCQQTLGMFSEQARHYMGEQEKLAEQKLGANDVLVVIQLNARAAEIDARLADIRADAQLLYARMCAFIIAVGGIGMALARDLAVPLALPEPYQGGYR